MDIFIIFFLILLVFLVVSKEYMEDTLVNIYNEPLQPCGLKNMNNGSWDNKGKCSELDGGVHQICIKNISHNTPNFSSETGQTNWSNQRGKDNHCVCLGAWSLYSIKKKTNKVLKCDAIPSIAFTEKYINKFKTWNGLELEGQIINGVEAIYNNCKTNDEKKNDRLRSNYCNFAEKVPELSSTKLFKKECN